jgi:hypothetical protein
MYTFNFQTITFYTCTCVLRYSSLGKNCICYHCKTKVHNFCHMQWITTTKTTTATTTIDVFIMTFSYYFGYDPSLTARPLLPAWFARIVVETTTNTLLVLVVTQRKKMLLCIRSIINYWTSQAKYRDLSGASRSIICRWQRQRQIIDLRDSDKSRYSARPRPIIDNCL